MFVQSVYSLLNVAYIRKVYIKSGEEANFDIPWGIFAEMDDGKEEILYAYTSEEEAQRGILEFSLFLALREKELDRAHSFYSFSDGLNGTEYKAIIDEKFHDTFLQGQEDFRKLQQKLNEQLEQEQE